MTATKPLEVGIDTADIISGPENVVRRALQMILATERTIDLFGDFRGPEIIAEADVIKNAYAEVRQKRGVRIRFITEITKGNMHYCNQLLSIIDKIRHLVGGLKSLARFVKQCHRQTLVLLLFMRSSCLF